MQWDLNRRDFLRYGALSAAALYAAPLESMASEGRVQRSGARKKVIILGAGLAGLAAGYELANAGHDVIILEAQLRPGGRVHTLREPFSDGLYAEAGAGRIPTSHYFTLRYVKEFDLTLEHFWPTTMADVYYLKGKRMKVPRGQNPNMNEVPLDLREDERKLGSFDAIEDHYIGKARTECGEIALRATAGNSLLSEEWPLLSEQWPPERLRKYDQLSIAGFFRQQGASEAATKFLVLGFEDDGALDFLHDAWSHSSPLYKIRGGNDQLPRAFADRLKDKIHYGLPAVRIQHGPSQVQVTCSQRGVNHSFTADYLICTLPFSVLRNLEIAPSFSTNKMEVIRKMRYGAVSRVYLQTRTRFWEADGCNGFASPDLPMEIWSPTFNQPGQRGIVMSYDYEALARKVGGMSPDERVADFLELTDKIFPGMRDNFEGGTSINWDDDPYARGAFSIFDKGETMAFSPEAHRAEGRVHFAGEHTSPWSGWMQGALYSGIRAAKEVSEA